MINDKIIQELHERALESPRLRANLCLHQSTSDSVQKMINVILPGSQIPIHRHTNSDETLIILRGSIIILLYDNRGQLIKKIKLIEKIQPVIDIKKGQWHSVEVQEPVTLFEIKEGPYRPLLTNEIFEQ